MKNKLYVKEGVGFEGITMMQPGKSKMPRIFRFVALLLLVVGLLGFVIAGIMQANKEPKSQVPTAVVLPTAAQDQDLFPTEPAVSQATTPTESALTPTKKVTPSPSSVTKVPTGGQKNAVVKVAVLNGSGVKGAARQLSTDLTAAGYEVSRTGNADAFTYTGITVQIKKSKQQFLDQLKKDLSVDNYLVSKSTADLDETEDTDVVIIVGAE